MNRSKFDSLSKHLKNHTEAINRQRPNCHLSRQSAKAEELKKKRLERFGPVDPADMNK
jgi:hypothetical protein